MDEDEQARKERAERLHEEVEDLKAGRAPQKPGSPREFVEEQGARREDEPHEDG